MAKQPQPNAPAAPQTPESSPSPDSLQSTPSYKPSSPPVTEDILNEAEAAANMSMPKGSIIEYDANMSMPSGVRASGTGPDHVRAGTVANPKRMPMFPGVVSAYALVRAEDGLYRAVKYTIEGTIIREIRTKEPDLKAILAAQITDAVALDMPLFNDDEDAPHA